MDTVAMTTSGAVPVNSTPVTMVAPVPLTTVPVTPVQEAPRVKRKYTRRAVVETAVPKRRGRPPGSKNKNPKQKVARAASAAPAKANKMPGRPRIVKTEKKPKRIAGVKAQGQVPKAVMRWLKTAAQEADKSVSALVGEIITQHATRRGVELDA